jgi:predicted MFS family arabinose efflux permease
MTAGESRGVDRAHRQVILAASLGTVFEWYDFYLYGSLAPVISKAFFAGVDETSGLILALLTFAAGFVVRPFGALFFGRLGDLVGRKRTFLVTIVIMGAATALVGLLPTYARIGLIAPLALVALRCLQGLALGGEYGGAAVYVAEHAPPGRRGLYTGWIQTTGTLGLVLSLVVILISRWYFGDSFETIGWRAPFLVSVVLLAISVWIRLQLAESPVFKEMVAHGQQSKAPLLESLGRWPNLKLVLAALFGAIAGMAVLLYAGQLYALLFLTQVLKVDAQTANLLSAVALILATPLYYVFGALSDRWGRKPLVIAGCALAALTYFPVFHAVAHFANPALEEAAGRAPVTVIADERNCSFQFDPVGKRRFLNSCDIAKAALARAGVPYATTAAPAHSIALVRIGGATPVSITAFEGASLAPAELKAESARFGQALGAALSTAGYPAKADPARMNKPMLLLLLFVLVGYSTLAYGPIAAWLVELFPARIRYTSLSVPYHVGVGWFGGFLPTVAFALVAITGDLYAGLWYPIVIAAASAIIGMLVLPETLGREAGP